MVLPTQNTLVESLTKILSYSSKPMTMEVFPLAAHVALIFYLLYCISSAQRGVSLQMDIINVLEMFWKMQKSPN